jgi:transposase
MLTQKNELDFSNQNIYVGFDVHKKSWKVTVLVNDRFHKTFSQDPKPEILVDYLKRNFPRATYYSAYEAGFCGFWIHRSLAARGVNSVIVNPADIPTTDKERTQKEDSRDSRKIARQLQKGDLKAIYIPSESTCDDRALLRLRSTLTIDLSRNKNRVKSFLNFNGVEIPPVLDSASKTWTKSFIKWLESLQLSNNAKETLDVIIKQCKNLKQSKLELTRKIRQLSETDNYKENVALLCSIPGVGLITSMEILTEIETIDRFESIDHFVSYIGFVPRTSSSGEKEKVGDITHRGHNILRTAIIECTWIAIGRDPALGQKYFQLSSRMEKNKAIVRIGKKLCARIYYVLKNKKNYKTLTVNQTVKTTNKNLKTGSM